MGNSQSTAASQTPVISQSTVRTPNSRFTVTTSAVATPEAPHTFVTDSAIGSKETFKSAPVPHQFEAWKADIEKKEAAQDVDLEHERTGTWEAAEMYATHLRKFSSNVNSTYDELMYTSKIDTTGIDFPQRKREAEALAKNMHGSKISRSIVFSEAERYSDVNPLKNRRPTVSEIEARPPPANSHSVHTETVSPLTVAATASPLQNTEHPALSQCSTTRGQQLDPNVSAGVAYGCEATLNELQAVVPATAVTNLALPTQSCPIMGALQNPKQAASPALQSCAIIAASLQNPEHAAPLKAQSTEEPSSAAYAGGRGMHPVQTGLTTIREKNHCCTVDGCKKRFFNKIDMIHHSTSTKHPISAPLLSSVLSASSIVSSVPFVDDDTQSKAHERSYDMALTSGLEADDDILMLCHEAAGWISVGEKRINASDDMEPINLIKQHVYADLVIAQKLYDEQNGMNAPASRATVDEMMTRGILANVSGQAAPARMATTSQITVPVGSPKAPIKTPAAPAAFCHETKMSSVSSPTKAANAANSAIAAAKVKSDAWKGFRQNGTVARVAVEAVDETIQKTIPKKASFAPLKNLKKKNVKKTSVEKSLFLSKGHAREVAAKKAALVAITKKKLEMDEKMELDKIRLFAGQFAARTKQTVRKHTGRSSSQRTAEAAADAAGGEAAAAGGAGTAAAGAGTAASKKRKRTTKRKAKSTEVAAPASEEAPSGDAVVSNEEEEADAAEDSEPFDGSTGSTPITWGVHYRLYRKANPSKTEWSTCDEKTRGKTPDSVEHQWDRVSEHGFLSAETEAQFVKEPGMRLLHIKNRKLCSHYDAEITTVSRQAKFERYMMEALPSSEYGQFLHKLFRILKNPEENGVNLLQEKVNFVRPSSYNVQAYMEFLRNGTTGDESEVKVICTGHKGKTMEAYGSAITGTCTKFDPISLGPINKALKSYISDCKEIDDLKQATAIDFINDLITMDGQVFECYTSRLKSLQVKCMYLLQTVLIGRVSDITTFCPKVQDIVFPSTVDKDGIPPLLNIGLRGWKGRKKGNHAKRYGIDVHRNYLDSRVCPVFWLTMWLAESRITSGPIFQPLSKDGSSVKPSVEAGGDRLTPKQYVNMLNVLLEKCKLYVPGHKPWVNVIERTSCCDACKSTFKDGVVGNVTWVKASGLTTHSFRRGAAMWAVRCGATDIDLANNGRWTGFKHMHGYLVDGAYEKHKATTSNDGVDPIFKFWIWQPVTVIGVSAGSLMR